MQQQLNQRAEKKSSSFLQTCYDSLLEPKTKLPSMQGKSQNRKRIYKELNIKIDKVISKCRNKTNLPKNKYENLSDEFSFPEDLHFDFEQGLIGKKNIDDEQLVPCLLETAALETDELAIHSNRTEDENRKIANRYRKKNDHPNLTWSNRKHKDILPRDKKTRSEGYRYSNDDKIKKREFNVNYFRVPETPSIVIQTSI